MYIVFEIPTRVEFAYQVNRYDYVEWTGVTVVDSDETKKKKI